MDDLRDGYDRIADEYAAHIAGELAGKPFDRALLERFAGMVDGPVLDAGCGPGHVARYLAERGAAVTGLDLSPGMVAKARELNPGITFRVGSMTGLPERDQWGGIVAFSSVIHVPRGEQVAMFATWRSALRPGGLVLLSFHIGTEDRHLDEFFGQPVSLDFLFFFFTPDEVAERMAAGGLETIEMHERDPYPEAEVATRRAYLLARRAGAAPPSPARPSVPSVSSL